MNNAAILTIKSVAAEADAYVVRGIASTPTPDLVFDIVEPLGCEAVFPLPLLVEHDRTRPVGQVMHATATPAGVEFEAHIPKVPEAGIVRERTLEVVHSIMHGLLRAVSIGFSALESEPLPSGGKRFKRWRWHELSVTAMPCNPGAVLAGIKSLEARHEPLPVRQVGRHSVPLLQRQCD